MSLKTRENLSKTLSLVLARSWRHHLRYRLSMRGDDHARSLTHRAQQA